MQMKKKEVGARSDARVFSHDTYTKELRNNKKCKTNKTEQVELCVAHRKGELHQKTDTLGDDVLRENKKT